MKRAALRLCHISSLLLALTIVISSLAGLARPTVAASIPAADIPAPAPLTALADVPEFPNCPKAGNPQHPCDLQVFLLIDDSSSMLYSDPAQLRYAGVKNVLDILAREYYLPAIAASDSNVTPPEVSVSLIHFNESVISAPSSQWQAIQPASVDVWPSQLNALDKAAIKIPLDYRKTHNTDFSKALEVTSQRAKEKEKSLDSQCPRLIMLFTDGVPNLTGKDLKGDELNKYMGDLLTQYHNTFQRNNDLFYVTEFGADPAFKKTWNQDYKPLWDQFSLDPGPADLPRIKFEDQKIQIAARMEGIISKAIGSPVFALKPTSTGSPQTFTTDVPEMLESLRLTFYYNVNTKTNFTVTGPDGKVIQADGAKATFSGADTPIQVFEIKHPVSGKYTITTTAPGGFLTQLLTFQKVTPKLVLPAGNALQQFTDQTIGIQLLGGDQQPLAILPKMEIRTSVTINEAAENVNFTQEGNSFNTHWLPLVSGQARIDACVTLPSNNSSYVLYNGPVGEIPIDKVVVQVGQSKPVCTLDDKDILVPLTLVNQRSGQPAIIDTPVEWPSIVATRSIPITRLGLDQVGSQTGAYVLHFRPATPGAVDFEVHAAAVTSKPRPITLFDEATIINSPGLQVPYHLALTLQNYNTLGDRLSVLFYKWLHPFCADRNPVVLIGRRWFGLFGPTPVQVSGLLSYNGDDFTKPGMERFSVQLVSQGGGSSSAAVNQWTALNTGEEASAVQIPSPGLGFYQVVVTDRGGSSGCIENASLPAAQTVLLVGDFWEYLIILAAIILLAVVAFLLRRRFRDHPNVLLVTLPIILLILDAILVIGLVNNTFKCQFNCSYLVDHSILGHYPADNELSLCRGAAFPLDNVTVIYPKTFGPVHFSDITIPPLTIFGWTIGPTTIIPAFDFGPFLFPGWTIPARIVPIFPALSFIDPPLEVLRRIISWGIIVLFVVVSLVLGNIVTRITDFIQALKDPQKRLGIISNISIWLLFFISFCALFFFRVVKKPEGRPLSSTVWMIIAILIGVLIIVMLIVLARRLSQKGKPSSQSTVGNVDNGPQPAPPDSAEPFTPIPAGNIDSKPHPVPIAAPEPAVPRPAENIDNGRHPTPIIVPEPVVPKPTENVDNGSNHEPTIVPEPTVRRPTEIVDNRPHPDPTVVPEPAVQRPVENVDNVPHPTPVAAKEPSVPKPAESVENTPNPAPIIAAKLAFRRTKGIVDNDTDPIQDADVIMTAVTLGLAATCIACIETPIRFDIDPEDEIKGYDNGPIKADEKEKKKVEEFYRAVDKMSLAIFNYLDQNDIIHQSIEAGCSPDYDKGGVIMGVYELAGRPFPYDVKKPPISESGRGLYDCIMNERESVHQYTGRGAYTGFVDNPKGNPVGPLSTARFRVPAPGEIAPDPHPRWLPPFNANPDLWKNRKRSGSSDDRPGSYVPWGLIGGDKANKAPITAPKQPGDPANAADELTKEMKDLGMVFNDEVTMDDIGCYTHGMIQAIYKAYHLGPGCGPYEIAVGKKTRKLASCLPCTLFMVALGYPPTSIHLGRGESWAPLYKPYTPGGDPARYEEQVVRDLNNRWYESCLKWLIVGLDILDSNGVSDDEHKASLVKVDQYLRCHAANAFQQPNAADQFRRDHDLKKFMDDTIIVNITTPDYTVGGVLILDALTIHDNEQSRIYRTFVKDSDAATPSPQAASPLAKP